MRPLSPGAAALLAAVPSGPDIGKPMPSFEAQGQDGKTRTLRGVLGPKGAVILFYRSADW
jgi:peroxiredoxin